MGTIAVRTGECVMGFCRVWALVSRLGRWRGSGAAGCRPHTSHAPALFHQPVCRFSCENGACVMLCLPMHVRVHGVGHRGTFWHGLFRQVVCTTNHGSHRLYTHTHTHATCTHRRRRGTCMRAWLLRASPPAGLARMGPWLGRCLPFSLPPCMHAALRRPSSRGVLCLATHHWALLVHKVVR